MERPDEPRWLCNCDRCNAEADDLVALTRYVGTSYATENVCLGCCTRIEQHLGSRIDNDPDLLAFVLAMADAVDRLSLAHGAGIQVPGMPA
jgi:hypothetical protein